MQAFIFRSAFMTVSPLAKPLLLSGENDRLARSPRGVCQPTQRRAFFRKIATTQDFVLDLLPGETASGSMNRLDCRGEKRDRP
jgi:hypothetical protein